MLYATLKQTNPAYQPKLWEKLDDLYVGGFQILDRANQYICKQVNEDPERYKERLALASYINYLGMVVDAFGANLFAQEPIVAPSEKTTIDGFWQTFAGNANLKNESFVKVLRNTFTQAVLKERAFIACDFPVSDVVPNTRLEEETLGKSRAYAFELPVEEMLDWEYADVVTRQVKLDSGVRVEFSVGLLSWAILRREVVKRATPADTRDTFVEEFRVWRMNEDGIAAWELYRTPPRKRTDAAPRDDLELAPVAEGPTSFKQIPILELCIPPGLWLGNKLGPIALEIFRRRSALHASEDRSLFPVPVTKLGPEIGAVGGAMPPEVQQNPTRGDRTKVTAERMGGLVLGSEDSFAFVEPLGTAHKLVDEQIAATVDELFRVASMMAASIANTGTALGRSGDSKQQDNRAMGVVLGAYGAIVRDLAERVYDVISEARGEDIDWKVHGLDKFDLVDRAAVLDEAKSLSLVSIPSTTFRVHWQTKVALSLLGSVTPEMQAAIEEEIEAGVAAEELMRDVMRENLNDGGEDPGAIAGRDGGSRPRTPGAQDGEGAPSQRAARFGAAPRGGPQGE